MCSLVLVMVKKLFVLAILLLSFGLVAAHGGYDGFTYKEKFSSTKYYPDENLVLSKTSYVNYDNDDRYSTYDYRHGYSYRTTSEYWDDHYFNKKTYVDYVDYSPRDDHYRDDGYHRDSPPRDDYYRDDRYYKDYYRSNEDYYYEYIPYLKTYEKRECYHYPPRDKLFYVKCP